MATWEVSWVDRLPPVRNQGNRPSCVLESSMYAAQVVRNTNIRNGLLVPPLTTFHHESFIVDYELSTQTFLDEWDNLYYPEQERRVQNALELFRTQGVYATSEDCFEQIHEYVCMGHPVLGTFGVRSDYTIFPFELIYELSPPANERDYTYMVMICGCGELMGRAYVLYLNTFGWWWGYWGLGRVYWDQILQFPGTQHCLWTIEMDGIQVPVPPVDPRSPPPYPPPSKRRRTRYAHQPRPFPPGYAPQSPPPPGSTANFSGLKSPPALLLCTEAARNILLPPDGTASKAADCIMNASASDSAWQYKICDSSENQIALEASNFTSQTRGKLKGSKIILERVMEDMVKAKGEHLKSYDRYIKEFHKRNNQIHQEKLDMTQREKLSLLKFDEAEGYLCIVQDAKCDHVMQLRRETEKCLSRLQVDNSLDGSGPYVFLKKIEDEIYEPQICSVLNSVMELTNTCNQIHYSQLHIEEIEGYLHSHYLPFVVRLAEKIERLDKFISKLKATGHRVEDCAPGLYLPSVMRLGAKLEMLETLVSKLKAASHKSDYRHFQEALRKCISLYNVATTSSRAVLILKQCRLTEDKHAELLPIEWTDNI
ncbi:hypothetical protein BRADI_3g29333v3 [Brachypodium distachyon]|uniref:Peptidase C1A papain C-terminal domain-containing protein n=3 Tax=Brachypodium distachyon TaxID=15368 RepID=A0A2K2CZZ1_BRADI|nr:hypothetical protein BRADI_3g29333v3 [Brachypodium distachyon]